MIARDDLFRAILEASPTATLAIDRDRRIWLVNRGAEALFAYPRAELLGQPLDLLIPAPHRDDHAHHVAAFFARPVPRAMGAGRELFGRRKGGSEVPIEIGLTSVELTPGQITAIATVVDVSARRRAEAEARAATARAAEIAERFALAASAARIGVWDWDVRTDHVTVDDGMHALFGTARDSDGDGAPRMQWRAAIHPDDRVALDASLNDALAGVRPLQATFRVISRGGDLRHVRAVAAVQHDAAGAPLRMIGLNLDITEQRAAELELRRSNAELEQFAYIASHDLQEPLRMVESFTALLAERYRGQLDDRADRYIQFAVDGARRMQQLIADLLAYSRVGSRGQPLRPVDTAAVVDRVLGVLAHAIAETGATIERDGLPVVMGDDVQLGQLFQNLVGNALKFRRDEPPRIRLQATRDGTSWLFEVADNGIGLDMKYADRVFEMFQRLHARDSYPGSGIGLAIAKRIVERHGGAIALSSTPGVGTTVRFTLAQAEPAEVA